MREFFIIQISENSVINYKEDENKMKILDFHSWASFKNTPNSKFSIKFFFEIFFWILVARIIKIQFFQNTNIF
jgi:hypothetical protein